MITLPKGTTVALLMSLTAVSLNLFACSKKSDETSAIAGAVIASATPAAPVVASPAACKACVDKKPCAQLPECSSLSGDARTSCEAVEKCVQTSNCADGKETFTGCFCGPLKMSACVDAPKSGAGAPSGACAAVIRRALGGDEPSNRDILARFTRSSFPAGTAIARMNCSKSAGCATECGF